MEEKVLFWEMGKNGNKNHLFYVILFELLMLFDLYSSIWYFSVLLFLYILSLSIAFLFPQPWPHWKSVVSDERSVEKGGCYFEGGVKKIANKVLGVITIEYLHKLSASIPEKIMAVIEEVGGHTNS